MSTLLLPPEHIPYYAKYLQKKKERVIDMVILCRKGDM
jgi:hypothetical protein